MTFNDGWVTQYCGNALEILEQIPEQSVQCVVTSPPYWGLRDYKLEPIQFPDGWSGCFGLEPTIEMYIEHSMMFMKAIWRVLKDDGGVWWNLGDSYAAQKSTSSYGKERDYAPLDNMPKFNFGNLKPLDLCLIPYRFALAAQAQGWYVRADVIWNKPNSMPESVNSIRWERHKVKVGKSKRSDSGRQLADAYNHPQKQAGELWSPENNAQYQDCPGCPICEPNDGLVLRKGSWRPTTAHEYIFMLTKTNDYYSDIEAVREKFSEVERWGGPIIERAVKGNGMPESAGLDRERNHQPNSGRNLRSVWTMNTQPFKDAHFAVYPEELPTKCILASTSEKGNCSKCGKPMVRVIDVNNNSRTKIWESGQDGNVIDWTNLGWRPQCKCCAPFEPAIVLDLFGGSGTTGMVAKKLGRKAILIEANESYCKMSERRIREVSIPMI